jgi:hypothetical protein
MDWSRRRRPGWRGPALLVGGSLVASIVLFAFVINPYSGEGMLDPWIYTGYATDYVAMYQRFGQTYYSTRVSSIWLLELGNSLVGEHGFVAVRALQFAVLLISVGAVTRSLFSTRAAAAVVALMLSSTWLLRAAADDYTQFTSITYLAVGTACITVPIQSRKSRLLVVSGCVLGGAFYYWSINAHPAILFSAAPFLLAFTVLGCRKWRAHFRLPLTIRPYKRFPVLVIAFCIGSLMGYAVLSIALGLRVGISVETIQFEGTTVRFSQALADGDAARWTVALVNQYYTLYLLIPASLVLNLLLARGVAAKTARRDRKRIALEFSVIASTAQIVFVGVNHFVLHGGNLGWHFTVVMFAPVFYANIVAMFGLIELRTRSAGYLAAIVGVSWLAAYALPRATTDLTLFWMLWITGIASALTFGVVANAFSHSSDSENPRSIGGVASALALAMLVLAATVAPFAMESGAGVAPASSAGYYALATDTGEGNTYALRTTSNEFVRQVNHQITPNERVLFYYPSNPKWLNSLQSTFLWMYSCVDCNLRHPFPQFLDPETVSRYAPATLVVLTTTLAEQDQFVHYQRHLSWLKPLRDVTTIGQIPRRAYVSIYSVEPVG